MGWGGKRSGCERGGEMDWLIFNSLKLVVFLQIAVIKMKLFIQNLL